MLLANTVIKKTCYQVICGITEHLPLYHNLGWDGWMDGKLVVRFRRSPSTHHRLLLLLQAVIISHRWCLAVVAAVVVLLLS